MTTTPRPTPAAALDALERLRAFMSSAEFRLLDTTQARADLDTLASALPAAPVEPEPEPRGGEALSGADWWPLDRIVRYVRGLDGDASAKVVAQNAEASLALVRSELSRLERELGEARATNTKLHRRCQSAEAGLAAKLDAGTGPCGKTRALGRALANSAATMYREQFEEVRQERDAARSALDEAVRERDVAHADLEAITKDRGSWRRVSEQLQGKLNAADVEIGALQSRLTAAEREAETARAKAIEEAAARIESLSHTRLPGDVQAWIAMRIRALAAPGAKEEANG